MTTERSSSPSRFGRFVKRIHYVIRIAEAVPLLVAIGIAAPGSTRESVAVETEEVEEEEQQSKGLFDPVVLWDSKAGEPPPVWEITPGLTNTEATKRGLLEAVRNIHGVKVERNLNFAEAFKELAKEIRGELPPQFEEQGMHEANEGLLQNSDSASDRRRRRLP